MRDQKGITLVALIITIIVMLILVAVTISVALNGGIFQRAREANYETKAAQVKEAMALAKADALADYYHTGKKTSAGEFENLVNSYLDQNKLSVTMDDGETAGTFELKSVSDADAFNAISAQDRIVSFDVPVATY